MYPPPLAISSPHPQTRGPQRNARAPKHTRAHSSLPRRRRGLWQTFKEKSELFLQLGHVVRQLQRWRIYCASTPSAGARRRARASATYRFYLSRNGTESCASCAPARPAPTPPIPKAARARAGNASTQIPSSQKLSTHTETSNIVEACRGGEGGGSRTHIVLGGVPRWWRCQHRAQQCQAFLWQVCFQSVAKCKCAMWPRSRSAGDCHPRNKRHGTYCKHTSTTSVAAANVWQA
jgi:hypothetical protein